MLKMLQRWFDKQVEGAWNRAQNARKEEKEMASGSVMKAQGPSRLGGNGPIGSRNGGMTFTIYKANGGHVLEYNEYDPMTDRQTNRLYIINSSQDLGEGIAQVIMMEHLQK